MVGRFVQDLRKAGRSLAQSPGFTSIAVAILTLGIGANATIFTLVNGLFLKPPGGVGEPAGLVRVSSFSEAQTDRWWSYPDYVFYRDRGQVFAGLQRRLGRYRVSATLVTLFAALALTLAAVGLYGTLSYLVAQSRRSIGVRMTLGAPVRRIVRSVVIRGLVLSGIGIAVGIAAAWAASRLVAGMVYGVSPRDPGMFLLVSVILVAVTCLASSLPALRASRVEPVEVLK